jgi:hypothetical protein
MSMEAHLAELERRHRALEAEIVEARAHPSIDAPDSRIETPQIAGQRRNCAPTELIAVRRACSRTPSLTAESSAIGFEAGARGLERRLSADARGPLGLPLTEIAVAAQ